MSALVIQDYADVKELVETIKTIDADDSLYNKYLHYKEPGGVTNNFLVNKIKSREWTRLDTSQDLKVKVRYPSHFTGFECFLCNNIHDNIRRARAGHGVVVSNAENDHYGCPPPKQFNEHGQYINDNEYDIIYKNTKQRAKAFRQFYDENQTFTKTDLDKRTHERIHRYGLTL